MPWVETFVRRAHVAGLHLLAAGVTFCICSGCGGPDAGRAGQAESSSVTSEGSDREQSRGGGELQTMPEEQIVPLSLGDGVGSSRGTGSGRQNTEAVSESLLQALDPLKVLTGTWRATPQRARVGDVLEEPAWAWDFRGESGRPAIVMTTNDSPYFRSLRISYDIDSREFTMTAECVDDQTRRFRGTFERPPMEFQGDDRKMHVSFKLTLDEIEPASERDQWQVAINQQDNNRYLVELSRSRGSSFTRFDTINTQRQGTSFALADDDYGDRTCIISGGLGTMQVSYQGKSYWVCCTGCQAAFNDDPEKWIARYEERRQAAMESP